MFVLFVSVYFLELISVILLPDKRVLFNIYQFGKGKEILETTIIDILITQLS